MANIQQVAAGVF